MSLLLPILPNMAGQCSLNRLGNLDNLSRMYFCRLIRMASDVGTLFQYTDRQHRLTFQFTLTSRASQEYFPPKFCHFLPRSGRFCWKASLLEEELKASGNLNDSSIVVALLLYSQQYKIITVRGCNSYHGIFIEN